MQLTNIGTAVIKSDNFRPNLSYIQQVSSVPAMPPIPMSDPTQAISDEDNGPFSSGESFDSRTKNADDVHPYAVPHDIAHIFACKRTTKINRNM